jgi:hypothetical protein
MIGTIQYMSPEQIQGVEADARSDIFSFGVMLFEMVTGKRTFEGKTQASIVGQILAVDPPSVSTLRPQTPPGLDRVIRLCLDKDPDERIQTVHDLKLQLQGIADAPPATTQAPVVAPARRSWLPWTAAALLGIATIALALAYLQSLRAPQVSVHAYILPPEKTSFALSGNDAGPPVLSPDGLQMAFVAKNAEGKQMLWIRPLNSVVAQPMSGTDGATFPFWSADSRYLAFFAAGKLNKLDASGGPPRCSLWTRRNVEQRWHHRFRAGHHLRPFARRCRWWLAGRHNHAGLRQGVFPSLAQFSSRWQTLFILRPRLDQCRQWHLSGSARFQRAQAAAAQ